MLCSSCRHCIPNVLATSIPNVYTRPDRSTMNRALRRGIRTLLQLVAAGGLTAIIAALADLAPNAKALILAGGTLLVAVAQNLLEASGTVPEVLPDRGPAT